MNNQIVGYMRYTKPSHIYYSKDRFWWKAEPLEFNIKDSYSEFNDINQQWIFEWDIVEMKNIKTKESQKAAIIFNRNEMAYVAIACDTFEVILFDQWKDFSIKLMSYVFINKELENELDNRGFLA